MFNHCKTFTAKVRIVLQVHQGSGEKGITIRVLRFNKVTEGGTRKGELNSSECIRSFAPQEKIAPMIYSTNL